MTKIAIASLAVEEDILRSGSVLLKLLPENNLRSIAFQVVGYHMTM